MTCFILGYATPDRFHWFIFMLIRIMFTPQWCGIAQHVRFHQTPWLWTGSCCNLTLCFQIWGDWCANNDSHTLRPLLGTERETHITVLILFLFSCRGVDDAHCYHVLFNLTVAQQAQECEGPFGAACSCNWGCHLSSWNTHCPLPPPVFRRENPHDAVVLHPKNMGKTLDTLPENRYSQMCS